MTILKTIFILFLACAFLACSRNRKYKPITLVPLPDEILPVEINNHRLDLVVTSLTKNYRITGGAGDYRIEVDGTDVIELLYERMDQTIHITPQKNGWASVLIRDKYSDTYQFSVWVNESEQINSIYP